MVTKTVKTVVCDKCDSPIIEGWEIRPINENGLRVHEGKEDVCLSCLKSRLNSSDWSPDVSSSDCVGTAPLPHWMKCDECDETENLIDMGGETHLCRTHLKQWIVDEFKKVTCDWEAVTDYFEKLCGKSPGEWKKTINDFGKKIQDGLKG